MYEIINMFDKNYKVYRFSILYFLFLSKLNNECKFLMMNFELFDCLMRFLLERFYRPQNKVNQQ